MNSLVNECFVHLLHITYEEDRRHGTLLIRMAARPSRLVFHALSVYNKTPRLDILIGATVAIVACD